MKIPHVETRPGLTSEQSRAIRTRHVSVALSAGAGCGKTLVLTERFLAHFDRRQRAAAAAGDLGRVVAITFTERAAREMRDRIRRKCYDRLLAADGDDAEHWAALLRGLDNARISTIHSFCASLLRSRAVEAGVDPRFEVLEQAQADTLLTEVVDDELRRLLADRDPVAFELATRFDLRGLHEMLRRLVLDCPADQFATWLQVSPEQQVDVWQDFHRTTVVPAIARQVSQSPSARKLLAIMCKHIPDNATMRARCEALRDRLATIGKSADGRNLRADLEAIQANARVQGGGNARAWESAEAYEQFKDAATKLRELAKGLLRVEEFDPLAAHEQAVVAAQLLAMADAVRRGYAREKRQLGMLDFNDLLCGARQLLTDARHGDLKTRLASQIDLLLVDEFQDTDPLQVEVVSALCGEEIDASKLFFVGDYKQSIYRFRGADPDVFRGLRERTPADGQQSLTRNFRSQPAILEFVNALFWDDLGDGYEPLRPERPQVSPTPAVEFLWVPPGDDVKTNKDSQRRREAEWIAGRIRALIDEGQPIVWDREAAKRGKPAGRAAQPGDFAILFRALSDVQIYEEALRQRGIDYYLVGGHAFYAQQEIFDLLNLLRALASRADVVSLAGVLRSAFFSLADETIFWIAGHPQGLSEGLFSRRYPAEIPSDEQRRARFAADAISHLRQCKDRLRICELIELALAHTGYDAALLNEFLGERKLANLRKLVEQARRFERGGLFGLSDFIAQLDEFVVRQPEEPLAATHSEDTNVVHLMTIHQSKGLEFPIVIVPDMDRGSPDRGAAAHFDPKLGPLVRLSDAADGHGCLSGYELWRFGEKSKELAELNRLLYVATTRAGDYLMLSSAVMESGGGRGPWMELMARRFDLNSGRLVGSLPADEPRPKIVVTTQEPPLVHGGRSRRARVDVESLFEEARKAAAIAPPCARPIDPIALDGSARRKYSFSRLAGTLDRQPEATDTIDPGHAPLDARGFGTLVHGVLAAMEFDRGVDLRALVESHAMRCWPESSADAEQALAMIERFAASPRARELAAAAESHAEVEFLLAWPPDPAATDEVVIGGYIDRLYRDSLGSWHVLDFKTNRVRRDELAQTAAAYEMQMLVYALATERILGSAPTSLTLHFLRTGAEHQFAWDDAARQRVIALVNEGIAAASAEPSAAVSS